LRATCLCLVGVAGLMGGLMLLENSFIFFPSKYPQGDWQPWRFQGRDTRPIVEDCHLTASDGVKLHGWYCRPPEADGASKWPVLLWLHGNAGHLADRYEVIRQLVQLPAELFILDYRGYGRSGGSPSEQGIYLDGQAAWDYLVDDRGIAPRRIILFGRSLGGAVAVELAGRPGVRPAGLIVESSFTSVPDMAATVMPIMPRVLIRTKLDSINKIGRINLPKLIVHSRDDDIVPFEQGQRLFRAAGEPKQFLELRGVGHNDADLSVASEYFAAMRRFIRGLVPAAR